MTSSCVTGSRRTRIVCKHTCISVCTVLARMTRCVKSTKTLQSISSTLLATNRRHCYSFLPHITTSFLTSISHHTIGRVCSTRYLHSACFSSFTHPTFPHDFNLYRIDCCKHDISTTPCKAIDQNSLLFFLAMNACSNDRMC